jgi:elongation factor 2 kinase
LSIGFESMLQSAEKGDKNSLFFIAKAYDTGVGLGKTHKIDWLKAYEYYQRVLNIYEDEQESASSTLHDSGYFEGSFECEPSYVILARMAEMNLQGGNGLDVDYSEAASLFTEAGDKAMLDGKGRLANKYFMRSEEASSMEE